MRHLYQAPWIVAAAAMSLLAGASARAGDTWEAYTYMPNAQVTSVRNFNGMAAEIDRQTDGRLKVKLHLGGTLSINAANISAAVSDDVVQMADDTQYLGNAPIGGILRLPFLVETREQYAKAYAVLAPYIVAAFAKNGVTVLASYVYPLQVLWSRQPTAKLEDLKGQKIRVTSPEQAEFVKRFGAIAVTLGTAEVPASLDRGVINGVMTASSGAGYTWRDLLKYNYRLGANYSDSLIVANTDRFNALSAEDRTRLREIATATAARNATDMQLEEAVLTQKMADAGMVVTPGTPEDERLGRERMRSYWDEWAHAHGPAAVEALQKVRAALAQ